jgi:hypothetical protein
VLYVDRPLVLYRRHVAAMSFGPPPAASAAEARAWARRWARNLVALNRGFARDLEVARRGGLVAEARAAQIEAQVRKHRREAHLEYRLTGPDAFPRKACAIAAAFAGGTTLRRSLRWALMALDMRLYFRVARRALRTRRTSSSRA